MILHPGMSRSVWIVFLIGVFSTIVYAALLFPLLIFPNILSVGWKSWVAEWWGAFGAFYLLLQALPIVSRPVTKDAWEIADNVSSFIPAALVIIGAPLLWLGGKYGGPDYWTFKMWVISLFVSLVDVTLTFVSLRISRNAGRITPA